MAQRNCKTEGFTLLELVIVVLIISLLIGGVLVGQSMVKSSELQAIASNFASYRDAIKLFQDKYKFLPGDYPYGVTNWGARAACNDTASDDMSETTCNGNGDGFVTGSTGTPIKMGSDYREALTVWQHLTNSKLLKGAYSGRAGVSVTWWKPGTNIPKGHLDIAGYGFSYAGTGSISVPITYTGLGASTVTTFNANYRHVITYGGGESIAATDTPTRMLLRPIDALTIDKKIDDGKPGRGNVLTNATTLDMGVTYLCVTSTDTTSANYLTTSYTEKCALFFITGM